MKIKKTINFSFFLFFLFSNFILFSKNNDKKTREVKTITTLQSDLVDILFEVTINCKKILNRYLNSNDDDFVKIPKDLYFFIIESLNWSIEKAKLLIDDPTKFDRSEIEKMIKNGSDILLKINDKNIKN
jgi:hypothetical protein